MTERGGAPAPRITTRGYYDRATGDALRSGRYSLFPRGLAKRLAGAPEVVVVVHGMRNDSAGASAKVDIATGRLRSLGYAHPVIGFSYDSDVLGAHKTGSGPLATAKAVAAKNGAHLAWFLEDFGKSSPDTRVRLVGHSLGSEVILSALGRLDRATVEAVYLFAASAGRRDMEAAQGTIRRTLAGRLTNYYWPGDPVLLEGHASGDSPYPVGLYGTGGAIPRCDDIQVAPENHRFASYAETLDAFP